MTTILEANIRHFRYPGAAAPALQGIELTVQRGEFVVVTGPAGSGKTTLVHCLTGVIPKAIGGDFDGHVRVAGQDLAGLPLPRVAGLLGMVNQSPENQLFNLTVAEDVAFGPENLCLPADEVRRRVRESLAFTGATNLAHRFSHLLSGGQSQRVVLAAVLALGVDLFVLDQPAGELDPVGRRSIYENISRLSREGKTVILVEDRLSDVVAYATRIVLMVDGRVVRDLPPRDFFADPSVTEYGVRVPDAVLLATALRDAGVPLPGAPLTVDEVVAAIGAVVDVEELAHRNAAAAGTPSDCEPDPGPPVVEIAGLTHRYPVGVEALNGVDLAIGQGEFVAIVGENGAGKTTLAKHLVGLLRPTQGTVRVLGHDLAHIQVHRISRWVGFLFQDPDLQIFNNTCLEEVSYGLRLQGLPADEVHRRALAALQRLGLGDLQEVHPYALSRGQRQRLAVASILAVRPPILVVDEPSTGLDYRETVAMMELLADYRAGGGTVIIITHDMEMALRFARRIVVMAGGRIVHDLPAQRMAAYLSELESSGILLPDIAIIAHRLGLPSAPYSVSDVAHLVSAAGRIRGVGLAVRPDVQAN